MKKRLTEQDLAKMGMVWNGKEYVRQTNKSFVERLIPLQEEYDKISIQIRSQNKSKYRFHMKPMSVNGAWKGRKFKSKEYVAYTKSVLSILPDIKLPDPPYEIYLAFGFSNKASDFDNPVKPIVDILQQKYNFNDKLIYRAVIDKFIVPKRQEYFEFEIKHFER